MDLIFVPVIISFLSLGFVGWLIFWIKKQDMGTAKMQDVYLAIKTGSGAYLKRQYKTIAWMSIVLSAVLYFVYHSFGQAVKVSPTNVIVAFLLGAFCSGLAGLIGMWISVNSNIRTASGAQKGLARALDVAMRAGAVSGIVITVMSLLGISALFIYYFYFGGYSGDRVAEIPNLIAGFGFGASLVALFAQLGGGIYTKAADVGADLVGKIEKGIPEDDPRNPAVIADLVGDNVGDCAGRGADLFESTAAENIAAMILGAALYPVFGLNGILFPLVLRALGLICSIVGVIFAKGNDNAKPLDTLNKGYFVTSTLAAIGFYFVTKYMLGNIYFFYAGLVGLLASIAFVYITQYYTSSDYRPIQDIINGSKTGHATNIISGLAVGFESTALTVITVCISLLASYRLGMMSNIGALGGIYGTAVATMGMLATAAYILAMDTFGPITDNAGGIVEMSDLPESVRKVTDQLDSVGNTTKALTKGYAMGSAALASFLLFTAYFEEAKLTAVNMAKVEVFIGGLLGAMLVFVFTALALKAVGKAAGSIVEEVRRQFKAEPRLMTGEVKPDYGKCVDITTQAALKQMIFPGFLAVALPITVGLVFKKEGLGAEAVAGFIMVGTITGLLLATVLNNAGGAWDNAKKYIEAGHEGGKGSYVHASAVTGDTVGDPFKDTAGPSLHVLIKLLGTLSLALVPLFL